MVDDSDLPNTPITSPSPAPSSSSVNKRKWAFKSHLLDIEDEDAANAFKTYIALKECADVRELEQKVTALLSDAGFMEYSLIGITKTTLFKNHDKFVATGLLSSHGDGDFYKTGQGVSMYVNNICSRHMSIVRFFIASMPPDMFKCEEQEGVQVLITGCPDSGYSLKFSGHLDLQFYVPMPALDGQQAADEFREKHASNSNGLLRFLIIILMQLSMEKFPELLVNTNIEIDCRAYRLLTVLAKCDVTLREAAEILHLSSDTINKHMFAAKAWLGAKTMAGVIHAATLRGLIGDKPVNKRWPKDDSV